MSGPYTQEQYERAKRAVSSGGIPPDKVPIVQQRITQYEDDRARGYLPAPAAKPSTSESLSHPTPKALDMGNSSVTDYLSSVADEDPKRMELVRQVELATMDDKLPNASKIKALAAPTEWKPKQIANPFSALPLADKETQYFYEPSLEEFQQAVASGALSKQIAKEFPGHQGELPPEWLAQSKAFLAYKDAAWKHHLAEAMKTNTPIVRVEFSPETGVADGQKLTVAGASASALDPIVAGGTGVLSGLSMGLADPLIRSVAPETAEAERRSRMRNPRAALAGEIVGSMTPWGLASIAAKGAAKGLGALGLGNKGAQGLTKSAVAGALTGAGEANVRAIAQAASDALDAGDSAAEAAGRIYDAIRAQQNTAASATLGGAMGAGGHLLGSAAGAGARTIAGADDTLPLLQHGAESGVKMNKLGGPVLPPSLKARVNAANEARANADDVLTDELVRPLSKQRLLEQEGINVRQEAETAASPARLPGSTIPTGPMADDIARVAGEIQVLTSTDDRLVAELNRAANAIRRMERASPDDIEGILARIDAKAKPKTGEAAADPIWNKVGAIVRGARDDFADPTVVENFALRDSQGNNKVVSGYSAMKTRQGVERTKYEMDNRDMGLPEELKAAPVQIGRSSATDAEAGEFVGKNAELARVQRFLNEDRAIASRLERGQTPQDLTPARVSSAIESAAATNRALREAVNNGYVHNGVIYRGAAMTPEQVSKVVSDGTMSSDSVWSASKDRSYAEGFALKARKAGREPVVFEIDGPAGVPLDEIPGSNTFQELGIPVGEKFNVLDSYRDSNGVLTIRLGSLRPTADDLATAAEPRVAFNADQVKEFKGKIKGAAEASNRTFDDADVGSVIKRDKLVSLAERAGVLSQLKDIQRLRDAQNWKQYLGSAINGISSGGSTYLRSNQLLRAVPTLHSLSGGLPEMTYPGAEAAVDKLLRNLVPETKALNLRGGQAARPAGSINHRGEEKKLRDDMTEEEAQFAMQVVKNILAMEGRSLRKAQ